jgi:hypothetical protein
MRKRSDSRKAEAERSTRAAGHAALRTALAVVVGLMLASCVFTDEDDYYTSFVIRFDSDGLSVYISLDHPVRLPLDEEDAAYIMEQSGCACRGELTLVGDYWQYPPRIDADECFIRINMHTGDIDCYSG